MRRSRVNAMLLNQSLKEHRKVKEQQATIGQMNKRIGTVEKGSVQVALQKKREMKRQAELPGFLLDNRTRLNQSAAEIST